jgi:hypothetical protein
MTRNPKFGLLQLMEVPQELARLEMGVRKNVFPGWKK